MVPGDVEMSHNTSGMCSWTIFPEQRSQPSELWPMAVVLDTIAASERGTGESSKAVRLL